MRHYDHLLDKFQVSNETRELADNLLRQAKAKTGRGSGRELGEFDAGLPAVCVLLASERLNRDEMSQKSAQAASCLKKKDFQRVYTTVRTAIEELEREEATRSPYSKLHEQYGTTSAEEKLQPYLTETENELMTLATGHDHTSIMFRCLVYFWVCSAAKLKTLTPTDVFAGEHQLNQRKFVEILRLLNMRKLDLRKNIQAAFTKRRASPSKQSDTVGPTPTTPRQPHEKAAATEAANDTPETRSKSSVARSAAKEDQSEPQTPRRSQRKLQMQQESLSKATPTRRAPHTSESPTKVFQPPPPRILFPNKGPVRELPSKDSPKKRAAQDLQAGENDSQRRSDATPEEPPSKRMKVAVEESPTKRITRSASASTSAMKAKAEAAAIKAVEAVEAEIRRSPRKPKGGQAPYDPAERTSPSKAVLKGTKVVAVQEEIDLVDSASSDEDSEPELPIIRRRFRPVYLEHRQWNARDPRLAKIWRKAEKRLNVVMQAA